MGSIVEKDYKKEADEKDVLYVKGQPVEGGKEELVEETDSSYGGKYGGAEKKIKEVKGEENFDLGSAGEYAKPVGGKGHGKKAYGGDSYTKEVKDIKYDEVDDKDKFGPEEGKFEEVKKDTKYDYGNYGGEEVKVIKEKKYGDKGGYNSPKEIIKEEVIKEEGDYAAPGKGSEGKPEEPIEESGVNEFSHGYFGGYLPEAPKGGYGPVVPNPKESYGGFDGDYSKQNGKKRGYGFEEKIEETKKIDSYGKPKGDYGGP